ncbi:MAG: amidotransferase [Acidobacteria bacterium]|nr:MAG: amidotransferase [Acidobacteriota bacterium]
MRAHYLQHVPFEDLGSTRSWLTAEGYQLTSTRFFESALLPHPEDLDLVIVLGGPMSVNDEARLAWLIEEKRFIRACAEAGKSVLGVCLGAQLIASAFGAQVYPNRVKEIGWFPIYSVTASEESIFRFPQKVDVFHWHGETFDLPPGAVHTARSEACENQAFQLGRSVIALQFHLETTPEAARGMVSQSRAELLPSGYVQSGTEILSVSPANYEIANSLMAQVLSFLRGRDS